MLAVLYCIVLPFMALPLLLAVEGSQLRGSKELAVIACYLLCCRAWVVGVCALLRTWVVRVLCCVYL